MSAMRTPPPGGLAGSLFDHPSDVASDNGVKISEGPEGPLSSVSRQSPGDQDEEVARERSDSGRREGGENAMGETRFDIEGLKQVFEAGEADKVLEFYSNDLE